MPAKSFPTRIDLSAKTRTAAVATLNGHLADLTDLATQVKHAHWNVKGPQFISLHELFDKLHAELGGPIDDIAERITALGGVANGTLRMAAESSRLKEFPANTFDGADVTAALADRYAALAKTVRKAIDETDELGDKDTADLYTGLSRQLDKALWFLEAHGQS